MSGFDLEAAAIGDLNDEAWDQAINDKFDVLLDGNVVRDAYAWNVPEGWVAVVVRDGNGLAVLNEEKSDAVRKTLHGNVEVVAR